MSKIQIFLSLCFDASNNGCGNTCYYGDLYTDNGQYMAKKSPYFDQITTLLRVLSSSWWSNILYPQPCW
ncbi:MAG: glycoside hydrolase family 70 protein [Streptococcus salivarius]